MYAVLNRYHTPTVPVETLITVGASGADYTTIAAALTAAAGATLVNPYRIYIFNGTYAEVDLAGDDYITVQGESKAGVIIQASLAEEDLTKDVWKINKTMTLQDLTLSANNVKYCVHDDSAGAHTLTLNNVHLKHATCFPLGCGMRGGQHIVLTDCTFEKAGANVPFGTVGAFGIFWHNWNDQASGASLTVTRGTFVNCGVANLYELGSEQVDLCAFYDCETDDETKGIVQTATAYYWDGGEHDIQDVPYSISPMVSGGTMPLPIAYDADERPLTPNYWYVEA